MRIAKIPAEIVEAKVLESLRGKVGPGPGSGDDFYEKEIVFCELTVLMWGHTLR